VKTENQVVKKPRHPIHLADIPRLGQKYWLLMTVVFIFMIAQLGEAILILHVYKNFDVTGMMPLTAIISFKFTSVMMAPVVLIVFNFTYSLISYPAGILSDRIGRYGTLIIGFLCLICGDIFLASADNILTALLGIAFAGAQMAITQSIFMSLVADSVPKDLRGTGFGIYYLVCSISALMSNWGAGFISESDGLQLTFSGYQLTFNGHQLAFTLSLAIGCLALALLFVIRPKKKEQCLEGAVS
jgi:MFS family permease